MNKDNLDLDIKKLKEDDRKFLLNRYLNEAISSHQGSMSNTAIMLSLLAILASGFSIVYASRNWIFVGVYAILSLLGVIILIAKYKKVQDNLFLERENIKAIYGELFKYHLAYAKKDKKIIT